MLYSRKGLYTGVVCDAMKLDMQYSKPFVLHPSIKSLYPCVLFGPAMTSISSPQYSNNDGDIKQFEACYPGCVHVQFCEGDIPVAYYGDITARLARKFGVAGTVINGLCRDSTFYAEIGYSIFSSGTTPSTGYGRIAVVDYNCGITMPGAEGDVAVNPGDYIMADADGVVVIPKPLIGDAVEAAERRRVAEENVRGQMETISSVEEFLCLHKEVQW